MYEQTKGNSDHRLTVSEFHTVPSHCIQKQPLVVDVFHLRLAGLLDDHQRIKQNHESTQRNDRQADPFKGMASDRCTSGSRMKVILAHASFVSMCHIVDGNHQGMIFSTSCILNMYILYIFTSLYHHLRQAGLSSFQSRGTNFQASILRCEFDDFPWLLSPI